MKHQKPASAATGKRDQAWIAKVCSLSDTEVARVLRQSHRWRRPWRRGTGRTTPPRWTPEEVVLLGTRSDAELARLLGRTAVAVGVKRARLRIPVPNPAVRRWTPEEKALLATMSDTELAAKLGLRVEQVRSRREAAHLPVFNRQLHAWTARDDARLGTLRDERIAQRLRVSVNAVKHRRSRLGILLPDNLRRPRRPPRPWMAGELALLGKINDREIAQRLHRAVPLVRRKRRELGISTPFLKHWNAAEELLLGSVPDEQIARQTGRSREAVVLHRQKLRRLRVSPPTHP
jgi:hypothetical protein